MAIKSPRTHVIPSCSIRNTFLTGFFPFQEAMAGHSVSIDSDLEHINFWISCQFYARTLVSECIKKIPEYTNAEMELMIITLPNKYVLYFLLRYWAHHPGSISKKLELVLGLSNGHFPGIFVLVHAAIICWIMRDRGSAESVKKVSSNFLQLSVNS